jgi:ECF sigma factor
MNIEKTIQIRASSAKTVCISLLCARTSCGAFLWIMREAATRVELRFFSGLSVEETAEFLRVSPETVLRLENGESLAAPGVFPPQDAPARNTHA